jgi:phosphoglycerate kinase
MDLKTVDQVDLTGQRVFIRVDFNVPLKTGKVVDDTRIVEALPTIQYVLDRRPRRVILASHLGRPRGKRNRELTLFPVSKRLSELLDREVIQADDCVGELVTRQIEAMEEGQVIVLENLRFHREEETNEEGFARALASLADVYVNDAFGAAHRSHASTVGMVRYVRVRSAGFLIKKEIDYLEKVILRPERPFVVVLGGAKVSDKIRVIQNLMEKASTFLIGGAMAYTFLRARGGNTGKSKVEEDRSELASALLKESRVRGCEILLPIDHVVAERVSPEARTKIVETADFPEEWVGVDIGPATVRRYSEEIQKARTIVWNGPMGVFEMEPFGRGTCGIAQAIAESGALSIVGGGDSVASVGMMGLTHKMSHISTGGGASLEFLEGKTLPGIDALKQKIGYQVP